MPPPHSSQPMAIIGTHLIFTCLIKHPLPGTLLTSLPRMLRKCKHGGLWGRSINHPGLAEALLHLCHLWLGGRGWALPGFNQMLLALARPGYLYQKFARELGDRGCINKILSFRALAKWAGPGAVAITGHHIPLSIPAQRGQGPCLRPHSNLIKAAGIPQ